MWIDDLILKKHHQRLTIGLWVPKKPMVVLGSGNDPEVECYVERCLEDNIPILRRYGGGGTVLLTHECLVLSVGGWARSIYENKKYFSLLNNALMDSLSEVFKEEKTAYRFVERGLSDIALLEEFDQKERKIVGTSLFRSRHYFLYQASVLVSGTPDLISYYLKYPSREPEYRRGKNHSEFLVFLSEVSNLNFARDPKKLREKIEDNYKKNLVSSFLSELISPIGEEMNSLEERLSRSREGAPLDSLAEFGDGVFIDLC